MSLDTLKRVIWRLQEKQNKDVPLTFKQFKRAVYEELGTDERTLYKAINALEEMEMIEVRVSVKEQDGL